MRKPEIEQEHPAGLGGIQRFYKFQNGYGASVIQAPYSYGGAEGLWELAVMAREGERSHICYATPITSHVQGYLDEDAVDALLGRIEALPAFAGCGCILTWAALGAESRHGSRFGDRSIEAGGDD